MAKAKSTKIEVAQVVKGVVLELSQDEAQTLLDIVAHHVNGSGRRKYIDSIYEALRYAGVLYSSFDDRVGMVTFKG